MYLSPMIATITAVLTVLFAASVPQPTEWKVGPAEGSGGRVLFSPNPTLLALARDRTHVPDLPHSATSDEKGVVKHGDLGNGWAFTTIGAPEPRTVLVEGKGFGGFYLNGEPFPGDPYGHGILRVPVALTRGPNRLLVRAIRGGFELRMLPADGPASLSPHDALLPDLRRGVLLDKAHAAVIVLNHLDEPIKRARLVYGDDKVFRIGTATVRHLLPLGMEKAPFTLRQIRDPEPSELDEKGRYLLPVEIRVGDATIPAEFAMKLREPGDAYRETRLSGIDDSVQVHAVRAPLVFEEGKKYALFLSLHGAGVKCYNQARAYRNKPDAFVLAPTNRRQFGFDWQDWGRIDALEALEFALANYPIDPRRVYLTGHSMGGHGTWYVGTLYPDRFAAIAPSAGWSSFFTYGGTPMRRDYGPSARVTPFEVTQNENDTIALVTNLQRTPIYVLHGAKDDNVPLSEAERMLGALGKIGHDSHVSHYQPDAGHWWGDECVDWVPLFEFCRRHRSVENPLRFTFSTFNPAVSAQYAWVTIRQQVEPGVTSRIEVEADPRKRTVTVKTENVELIDLDLSRVMTAGDATVTIDGTEKSLGVKSQRLRRTPAGAWGPGWSSEDDHNKNPARAGPFKLAFTNRMIWVYGTGGTADENAATLSKVRNDAAAWWYRGNGRVRILADRNFDGDLYKGRNVILYGNRDTNSAFSLLIDECPIRISRDTVIAGRRKYEGDFGALFVYPGNGALVGVVGATSVRATRMLGTRYFVSGVAVPDWVIFDEEVLTGGLPAVAASGYFTNEWKFR
jgi:predicted esterase